MGCAEGSLASKGRHAVPLPPGLPSAEDLKELAEDLKGLGESLKDLAEDLKDPNKNGIPMHPTAPKAAVRARTRVRYSEMVPFVSIPCLLHTPVIVPAYPICAGSPPNPQTRDGF